MDTIVKIVFEGNMSYEDLLQFKESLDQEYAEKIKIITLVV